MLRSMGMRKVEASITSLHGFLSARRLEIYYYGVSQQSISDRSTSFQATLELPRQNLISYRNLPLIISVVYLTVFRLCAIFRSLTVGFAQRQGRSLLRLARLW